MPARVVDASVVGAWCFGETRADEAFALLYDVDLHAPPLLAYELANIAWKKAELYGESPEMLQLGLRTARALPLHWAEVDHSSVLDIAIKNRLTAYGASYLFVARELGVSLATFDRRLATAAQTL